MGIKGTKLYDPESCNGLFPILPTMLLKLIIHDATILTFDLNKQYAAFFHHGDQAKQVV